MKKIGLIWWDEKKNFNYEKNEFWRILKSISAK